MESIVGMRKEKSEPNITDNELCEDDGTVEALYRSGKRITDAELKKRYAYEANLEKQKIQEAERLRLEKEREHAESAKVIRLASWPEGARGVPNGVLRGSLFAAIQEKHAKSVRRMVLHDKESLKIVYTGRRLTQTDLDVWEYALHLSRNQNLGNQVYFTERAFLKGIGRSSGRAQHDWLKKVIADLSATTVEITHNGYTYLGSLIEEGFRDEQKNKYCIVINPKLARLYEAGHTYINWGQRQLLGKRKPLAQWLHGYISSHKRWVPHKVETLKEYSGSETREIRRFKQSLNDALELLRSKKLIKGYLIDSDYLVHITYLS